MIRSALPPGPLADLPHAPQHRAGPRRAKGGPARAWRWSTRPSPESALASAPRLKKPVTTIGERVLLLLRLGRTTASGSRGADGGSHPARDDAGRPRAQGPKRTWGGAAAFARGDALTAQARFDSRARAAPRGSWGRRTGVSRRWNAEKARRWRRSSDPARRQCICAGLVARYTNAGGAPTRSLLPGGARRSNKRDAVQGTKSGNSPKGEDVMPLGPRPEWSTLKS